MPSSLGAKKPMVERREPIVTEWALADALYQLVNLIEELRIDVNLSVEITTDDTQLLKLSFSGTPDVGFPLQREVCDIPGQVVRRVWNEGLRDYETPTASATPSDETGAGRHAHSEPVQYGVTPDQSRPARHHRSAPAQPRTRVGHDHGASNLPGSVIKPTRVPAVGNDDVQVSPVSLTLGNASFPRSSPTRSRGVDQGACE